MWQKKLERWFYTSAGILSLLSLVIYYGFHLSREQFVTLILVNEILVSFFFLRLILRFVLARFSRTFLKENRTEAILVFLLLVTFVADLIFEDFHLGPAHSRQPGSPFSHIYFLYFQIFILYHGILALASSRHRWLFISFDPAKVLVYSFLLFILIGTVLLKLPRATVSPISWIDALFISTSAVCVTGLSTVNVAQQFTLQGQMIILVLIQIGGLGIVTLTSFAAFFSQRGVRLKEQFLLMEILDNSDMGGLRRMLRLVLTVTFGMEFLGAVLLFIFWHNHGGFTTESSFLQQLFYALFHSVSAFCNAGFSIFPNGLEEIGYATNYPALIVVMMLIVIGGLGFYTWNDILYARHKSLQTKLVLMTTAFLLVGGAVFMMITEFYYGRNMDSLGRLFFVSMFNSVTARTAGFSIENIANLAYPTMFAMLLLMYIGGSPGSTAGGIKNTTFVMLASGLVSFVRGKDRVELGWHTLPMNTMRRAFVVLSTSILVMFVALWALTFTEKLPLHDLLFEVVSALGTVGLTRGITPQLSDGGKIILTIVMFLGRIGFFTIAIALGKSELQADYKFPEANILVG